MADTIASYVHDVLTPARHEQITLPPLTQELQAITSDMARPEESPGAAPVADEAHETGD
jgi:hypothetical protein